MNIIVASSSGLLCAGFAGMNGVKSWWIYGLFSFFSTLAVYNGQRLFKSKTLEQTPWLIWVGNNRRFLFSLSVLSSIMAGIMLFLLPVIEPITIVLLGCSSLISMLYVLKVKGTNMRQVPHLKIHLISASWVAVIIVFPVINEGKGDELFWAAIAHYLYVLAVAIPFDIRDLKYDSPGQRTIPQVIGVNASKLLSVALLVSFVVLMLCFYDPYLIFNPWFFIAVLVQIILVLFMNEKRSDIYCAGLIDGAIALLGASYFLL